MNIKINKTIKYCSGIIAIVLISLFFHALSMDKKYIHFFYSNTCPHCKDENVFLDSINGKYPELEVKKYEISTNRENYQLINETAQSLDTRFGGVPFLIIGDEYIIGFDSPETTGVRIEETIQDYLQSDTPDVVERVKNDIQNEKQIEKNKKSTNTEGRAINFPLIGKVDSSKVSLPVFTFFIALLDGFNPCAMWVLLFLISFLLGMEDRKRMWILGVTFIIASGFVYFLFLSAWLNFFLLLGYTTVVRVLIGLLALGAGGYYLYDFCTNKSGGCKVTDKEDRKEIFEKIKKNASKENILLAMLGMITLAFMVNVVELLCSAGLPAVYTEVLSLSDLPTAQYYIYLLFYIVVFMLDDLIIFTIAMITLKVTGVQSKYSRYSHLIGGILMLLIGLLMLFKPELLMFA